MNPPLCNRHKNKRPHSTEPASTAPNASVRVHMADLTLVALFNEKSVHYGRRLECC